MLAIGRGLMLRPKLMLLDEPSLGLSPKLVSEISEIILRLNKEQGVTILLVEQNAKMALDIGDYGFVMELGRIVMEDSCSRLKASTDIQEFYLGMKDEGVRALSVHPGGIFTPLQRHLQQEEMIALGWLNEDGELSEMAAAGFKSATQGASTTLWCATNPKLDGIGGVYCENCDVAARQDDGPNARYVGVADWAIDTDEASRLWEETEKTIASL